MPPSAHGPMNFDPVAHTQGGLPDLLALLRSEFQRHLDEEIKARRHRGQLTLDVEQAMARAPFTAFFNFCRNYLRTNRPVEAFAVDYNYGIKLSNNLRCVVSPGTDLQGTMQDAGAVAVTHGLSQPGQGGVVDGGSVGIF